MELFSFVNALSNLFIIVCFFLLIYFIFKRIEDKKREDFEDRDY